jgi:uncharacterized protein (DUF433 family)
MIALPETVALPLRMDKDGTIRVRGTRVILDIIIARYNRGASPEEIQESFDVLHLNDVYAVIAYYLANREELDAYLAQRAEEAERIREQIEASYTPEQRARQERLRNLAEARRRA